MATILSALGIVSAVAFALAPQFSAINPRVAAYCTLIGTAVSAASGALTKFGVENKTVTILGVALAVVGVGAGAVDLLPSNIVFVLTIAGTVIAAVGKSLFGWDAPEPSAGPTTAPFKAIIGFLLVGSLAGGFAACAKKIPGESAEQYKARAVAIRVDQAMVGFDLAQDFLIVLSDFDVIGDAKQPSYFALHDKALSAFDVVATRLQSGLPVDANDKQQLIARIDAVLVDCDAIVKELGLLNDPDANAKAVQVVSSIRLALNSIKIIVAASDAAQPSVTELKAKYGEAIAQPKGPKPGWWDAVVTAIANQVSKMLLISAYTDPASAWSEAFELSKAQHAENANRNPK